MDRELKNSLIILLLTIISQLTVLFSTVPSGLYANVRYAPSHNRLPVCSAARYALNHLSQASLEMLVES